jgi:dTDP-glucose 4,6-dehydratase
MTRVLLTGASGFVGSHVLAHVLAHTDWDVVCPVSFRHHGVPGRITDVFREVGPLHDPHARTTVVVCDLSAPIDARTADVFGDVDLIMNVASDSHVDRSITDPATFLDNNSRLITTVLDYARAVRPRMVLQMSTDEVYGPAEGTYAHREWDPIRPSNPYSASKAAQEAVCHSYWRTYDVPVVITNTMNLIGPRQDAEKFLPMCLSRILSGERVDIHASPEGVPGSRFYLHAGNLAHAWVYLADTIKHPALYSRGAVEPDRFHIVGEREIDNLTLYHLLREAMIDMRGGTAGLPPANAHPTSFHATRPGHDLRYALDGSKLAGIGWTPPMPLTESIRDTVRWYLTNPGWLR